MGTACVSSEVCCSKSFYCLGSTEISSRNIEAGLNVQEIQIGSTPGMGSNNRSGAEGVVELS